MSKGGIRAKEVYQAVGAVSSIVVVTFVHRNLEWDDIVVTFYISKYMRKNPSQKSIVDRLQSGSIIMAAHHLITGS